MPRNAARFTLGNAAPSAAKTLRGMLQKTLRIMLQECCAERCQEHCKECCRNTAKALHSDASWNAARAHHSMHHCRPALGAALRLRCVRVKSVEAREARPLYARARGGKGPDYYHDACIANESGHSLGGIQGLLSATPFRSPRSMRSASAASYTGRPHDSPREVSARRTSTPITG